MLLIYILHFLFISKSITFAGVVVGNGLNCLQNCEPVDVEIAAKLSKTCSGCDLTAMVLLEDKNIPCLKETPPCKAITMMGGAKFEINANILPLDSNITAFFDDVKTKEKYYITLATAQCKSKINCMANCNYFYDQEMMFNATTEDPKCIKSDVDWTVEPEGKEKPIITGGILKILANSFKDKDPVVISSIMNKRKVKELLIRMEKSCKIVHPIDHDHYNAKLVCNFPKETKLIVYGKNTETGKTEEIYAGPNDEPKLLFKTDTKYTAFVELDGKKLDLGEIFIPDKMNVYDYVFGKRRSAMNNLLKNKKFDEAYKRSLASLDELNLHVDYDETKIDILRHLSSSFVVLAPEIGTGDMLTLLKKVMTSKYFFDPTAITLIAECLSKVAEKFFSKRISISDAETEIKFTMANLTSDLKLKIDRITFPNITKISDNIDYTSYDVMEYENVKFGQHMRRSTFFFIKTVAALGGINSIPLNNDYGSLTTPAYITRIDKLDGGHAVTIDIPKTSSRVDISQNLADELKSSTQLYLQIVHFDKNPSWWDIVAKDIGTDVLMVNLLTDGGHLAEMTTPVDLYFHVNQPKASNVYDQLTMKETNWRVYQFQTKNNSKIIATIKAVSENLFAHVSIYYPSYDESRLLGKQITAGNKRNFHIASYEPLIYVSIIRLRDTEIKYEISVISIICISWDMKSWEWTQDGCFIGNNSNSEIVHCSCNHFSLFGASFLVVPNQIQLYEGITFKSAFADSKVVFGTIMILIFTYICALAWASYRDKVLEKRAVCLFPDTIPGDKHIYLIGILTGLLKGAATTAHISIQLYGTASYSRRHIIPFNSFYGDEDWYLMATPKKLGHIFAVRLFHDSYGNRPDWFCERIIVRDLKKRKQYTFIAQAWLSLLKGDGLADRTFKLSEGDELRKGSVLFSIHARNEMRDSHLLFSVFTRPPDSTFTCKERITLAFTVLFLSLTSSAMFYRLDSLTLDPQGSFYITFREIVIVCESLLITVPIGVTITLLFRRSRPL